MKDKWCRVFLRDGEFLDVNPNEYDNIYKALVDFFPDFSGTGLVTVDGLFHDKVTIVLKEIEGINMMSIESLRASWEWHYELHKIEKSIKADNTPSWE